MEIEWIGAGLGFVTLWFGIFQYFRAQVWKRSEFAAAQLDKLNSDADLRLACTMIDWSERELPIPEHRKLNSNDHSFQHTTDNLKKAMRTEANMRGSFSLDEALKRDIFDRFFAYLEDIEHYLEVGLISKRQVKPLRYWLKEIADSRFSYKPIFHDYLSYYGFDGVFRLLNRFQIDLNDRPKPER